MMKKGKKDRPWGSNFPNLKGKKTHSLSCQCCDAYNIKEEEREKEDKREIKKEIDEFNSK